ncbi:MAG: DUF4838 domain-containing protein [Armatimonadota bacterium]|jgi:hypothetical protein
MIRSLALIALCAATVGLAAADVTLVRDGTPVATIVIPDSPAQVVRYAAEELQQHVELASGATLAILNEADAGALNEPKVFIGATQAAVAAGIDVEALPPEGWVIRAIGGDLYLAGRDARGYELYGPIWAGSLWATYELLESEFGVRWLWPGDLGTHVPEAQTIAVPEDARSGHPQMIQRNLRSAMANFARRSAEGTTETDYYRRAQNEERVWLRRMRMGSTVQLGYGHAFTSYWERYGEEHPEYFNLLPNGKREPLAHQNYVSMCVAEPGLHQRVVDNWLNARAENPNAAPNINACENDTAGLCICEKCLAWDVPESGIDFDRRVQQSHENFAALATNEFRWDPGLGSVSDRYARFYLAVQDLAREHDPDVIVMGYAYGNYRKPPLETKLNENVIIGYVPRLRFPDTAENLQDRRAEWQGWSDAGARLLLRPNYFLYGHNMPHIFAEQFGREFSFCARNGMIGTDFDSLTAMWGTQGPNLYMLGRMHARPEADPQQVLAEYYAGFGPAASQVRAYFDYWAERSKEISPEIADAGWHGYIPRLHELWTAEMFAEGAALLARATAAADGAGVFADRVEFLRLGLEHARLTAEVSRVFAEASGPEGVAQQINAMARLNEFRASLEDTNVANLVLLPWLEMRYWEVWPTEELEGREVISQLPMDWKLRWDPEEVGREQGWFDPAIDAGGWHDVRVDAPWEKQPVGEAWRIEHGRDYDGLAFYRVSFELPEKLRGRAVHLLFGAVDEGATVWVNGELIGERPFVNPDDWTTPFAMEFTDVAEFGATNTVVVQVEDRSGAGGVWKPVLLIAE